MNEYQAISEEEDEDNAHQAILKQENKNNNPDNKMLNNEAINI
ncbi:10850_t:CDS:2 [Racocetra fulgida]|uniref:10850_t:CDS:1 n=1 Tax=Racocetra fulgida TaxID=60492 RepID=A0A9N9FBL1_9GLOM|nr:10850_t:CDS:2 [Racocetra fulgida]